MKRLTILLLCVCLVLSGCASGAKNALGFSGIVKFSDMEYVRPDLTEAAASRDAVLAAVREGKDADQVLEAVWDFYEVYDRYMTSYDLSYIHYHADLTDFYWQTEQEFCAENVASLDMYLEEIYCAIAESPLRSELEEEYFGEGWFDAYAGGGFYDEELVALMEREQELIGQYYDLSGAVEAEYYSDAYFDECAQPMADILAELVILRQELAAKAGYDSYTDFAWDYYYYRDYTPQQTDEYLEEIRTGLTELYRRVSTADLWAPYSRSCTQEEVFDYGKSTAQALGGVTADAFLLLEQAELYDISVSDKKSGLSFEVYLTNYYEPFVFVSGTGTAYDCLTFVHEFGHFANDYAAAGSVAGIDVMEVFSQGMEYLSLCYADAPADFAELKLADSLTVYVEQAAYAAFERAMYDLPAGEVTGEGLLALYEEVCTGYGFGSSDWDPRDLVTVPHFYGNPLYVISYVVSNDAAMQLYELELQTPGSGKAIFERSLDTEQAYFMAFLEEAGLESPFTRVDQVKTLMEQHFGV